MKYLKLFNESKSTKDYLIEDCRYILSDLSDDGKEVTVSIEGDSLFIGLYKARYNDYIKLNEYYLAFKQLLSFLKSYGYSLKKNSFVTNDNWDDVVFCPKCKNSNYVSFVEEEGSCSNCEYISHIEYFIESRHWITEGDLIYYIKHNYWVDTMHLHFIKA
jgi:hypothetical protein